MAYSSTTYVQAEFKKLDFSATGATVDTTKAGYFLAEADAYIDSRLSGKYRVPLTSPNGLLIARTISTLLVADRVRKILEVSGQDPGKNQSAIKDENKTAMSMLGDLVSGKTYLPSEILASSDDGVKSFTQDQDVDPVFDVEKNNW